MKKVAFRFKNRQKKSPSHRKNLLLGLKKWLSDQIPEEILPLAEAKSSVAELKKTVAEVKNLSAEERILVADLKITVAEERNLLAKEKIPVAKGILRIRKHGQAPA